jgi:serine protease Do
MKKILLITLSFFYIGCSSASDKYADIVGPMLRKTVVIETAFNIDGKVARFLGGGVFISHTGHILTCYHLFNEENLAGITVTTYSKQKFIGEMIYNNPKLDLALIKISASSPRAVVASPNEAKIGIEVLAIGHPEGFCWTVTTGILSTVRTALFRGRRLQQHSALVSGGSSGGPIFNLQGRLVGIHVLSIGNIFVKIPGLSFAVGIDDINAFLSKVRGLQ